MHTVLHTQNFDRFQIPEANLSLFQPTRQSTPFTAQTMSAGIFASDLRPGSHEHTPVEALRMAALQKFGHDAKLHVLDLCAAPGSKARTGLQHVFYENETSRYITILYIVYMNHYTLICRDVTSVPPE